MVFCLFAWPNYKAKDHYLKVVTLSISPAFQVVGRNRFPRLQDQAELHYTNAVLLESFRVSSLTYSGLPRFATQVKEIFLKATVLTLKRWGV